MPNTQDEGPQFTKPLHGTLFPQNLFHGIKSTSFIQYIEEANAARQTRLDNLPHFAQNS